MTRGKTPAGFLQDKRKRRESFHRRRAGLLTKAEQLSTLCGVPVAVVCADLNGGAPTVMETEQGVLERYRALPDVKRAEHAHHRYLDGLLVKEKAKLARTLRAGPEALAPPHGEMARMTLAQLHDLLQSVDKAMAAAAERRRALGLPPPAGVSAGYFHPMQQQQGQAVEQPMIWQGLQAHGGGHYYMAQPAYDPQPQYNVGNGAVHLRGNQQPMLSNYQRQLAPDAYFQPRNAIEQPCNCGGYQQQMPSNYHMQLAPGAIFQPNNAIAQPWNQYDDGGSSHVGSWMQGPSNGNGDLAIWSPAESSNAIAVYPYMHTSGNPPAAPEYPHQFTGDNSFPVDMGNGMNYLETHGSSNDLQQYTSASQNSSSVRELFRTISSAY